MEHKSYVEVLGKNNLLQNQMALTILIDYGRENFLNKEFVDNWIKDMKDNPAMTKEFQIELINIAKDMAELNQFELYKFIKNEVNMPKENTKKHERGR